MTAITLLTDLRKARESYERNPVGRNEQSVFWNGLRNRWDKVQGTATLFSKESPVTETKPADPATSDPLSHIHAALVRVSEQIGQVLKRLDTAPARSAAPGVFAQIIGALGGKSGTTAATGLAGIVLHAALAAFGVITPGGGAVVTIANIAAYATTAAGVLAKVNSVAQKISDTANKLAPPAQP